MKPILLFIITNAFFISLSFSNNYKGSLGIHPFHNQLSWRTNISKTHFWDYKIQYQTGTISGVPFINLSPQINYCWRRQNLDQIKFYWGIGMGFETFVPRFKIPLGIETFPLKNIEQLSFSVEASPIIIFLGPGMITTTIKGDLSINYYFNRKQKQ